MTRATQRDALEMAAVCKGNGFCHLQARAFKGNAHGLFPEWDVGGHFATRSFARAVLA